MSTRSIIAIQSVTGRCKSIYCHSDGYVSHNGMMLFQHYHSRSRADALIKLGSLSSLGKEIGQAHSFDWRMDIQKYVDKHYSELSWSERWQIRHDKIEASPYNDWCLAYGRDRGSTDVDASSYNGVGSFVSDYADSMMSYIYLWANGTWWLLDCINDTHPEQSSWVPLYDAIKADEDSVKILASQRQRYPVASPDPYMSGRNPPLKRSAAAPVLAAKPLQPSVTVVGTDRSVVTGRSRTIVL